MSINGCAGWEKRAEIVWFISFAGFFLTFRWHEINEFIKFNITSLFQQQKKQRTGWSVKMIIFSLFLSIPAGSDLISSFEIPKFFIFSVRFHFGSPSQILCFAIKKSLFLPFCSNPISLFSIHSHAHTAWLTQKHPKTRTREGENGSKPPLV